MAQRILREAPPDPEGQAASTASFETLYRRHAAFTWRALRHLGVEAHAVDDAMQELWVIVHRRLREFEGRSRLETWLFGIALNVARNQVRAARRRASPLVTSEPEESEPTDGQASEERLEAFGLVHEFLATLDAQRREVFVSTLLAGMTAVETAEATGLDPGRVQNLVRALRRTFKAWLQKRGCQG